MAAKIVGDVDMAPRTALILALPTGLLLANAKGWTALPAQWLAAIVAGSLLWLVLAWWLHLKHATGMLRTIDLAVRWAVMAALLATTVGAFVHPELLPAFIAIKCGLLAAAILMGLLIRRVLTPLGPALAGLAGDTPQAAEEQLAQTLQSARPLVIVIWALLLTAAFFGLWTPTTF